MSSDKSIQAVADIYDQHTMALADAMPQIVWTSNPDGELDYYNRHWIEYTGLSIEQTKGWGWGVVLHPDDLQNCIDVWTNAYKTGTPYEVEYRFKRASDGTYRWHLGRALPVRDMQGKIIKWFGTCTDIEDQKHAFALIEKTVQERTAELAESEQRFRSAFQTAPHGMALVSTEGAFIKVNPALCAMLGFDEADLLATDFQTITHPDDLDSDLSYVRDLLEKRIETYQMEKRYFHKNGSVIWILLSVSLVRTNEGVPVHFVSQIQDITDRKRIEAELKLSEERFRTVAEAMPQIVWITRPDGWNIYFNQHWMDYTGLTLEASLGHGWNTPFHPDDQQRAWDAWQHATQTDTLYSLECRLRREDGIYRWWLIRGVSLHDANGNITNWFGTCTDIEDIKQNEILLKQHEAELKRIAHFDTLTSIPNRVLLADRMRQAISKTSREQNMMAVCYLDLDGFKPINDTFGHDTGDHMLIEVAKRIENTIRGGDTVARLGGDEFVVLLLGLDQGEECVATLERLLVAIAQPFTVKDKLTSVSASIGVSIYPLDHEDPDTLLRHADQAMYSAKQSGKNRFHIYDSAMDRRARDQNEFLKSIRYALENNQFELHYQPKVNLRSKELVGAEALIRWRHPERGLLSPAEFLRHIENTDLDIKIGEWVTATALAQMSHWRSSGLDIEVSINITGYHLETPGFVEKLSQQIAVYPDMPFGKLQIEVLETVALNDITVVRGIIESCRKIGVGFALDDFGTGYSSLSYLSGLPVDVLKIDQSFVRDMLEDKGDMAIVQGIIALALAFDRQTVAEGIETEEHYQVLLDMGCELGQGYGIARPMSADELIKWRVE